MTILLPFLSSLHPTSPTTSRRRECWSRHGTPVGLSASFRSVPAPAFLERTMRHWPKGRVTQL